MARKIKSAGAASSLVRHGIWAKYITTNYFLSILLLCFPQNWLHSQAKVSGCSSFLDIILEERPF